MFLTTDGQVEDIMPRQGVPYRFYLFILLVLFSVPALGEEGSLQGQLAENYQHVMTRLLQEQNSPRPDMDLSVEGLLERLSQATTTQSQASLLAEIFQHWPLLETHVDHPRFSSIPGFLLDAGLEEQAKRFLRVAEQNASDYGLATVRLAFAQHYAESSRWDEALLELSRIAINIVLDPQEADRAYVLYGFSLQGKRQHREAVGYYKQVREGSPHYPWAQLNTALAYLRQDWWTDAETAIEAALSSAGGRLDDTSDRLHTVLGFSQIQHGFYRRARDSFRKVRVDGRYANRALLGLGLSALHQQDLVAALNAFDHLKTRGRYDLSVAESYLLSAFTLGRINSTTSASASYAEAIAFFQQYLAALEHQSHLITQRLEADALIAPQDLFSITEMISDADAKRLHLWQQRLQVLDLLLAGSADEPEGKRLSQEINNFIGQQASEALTQRQHVIESYVNQAQFGLATLYDSK